jgi:hydrogenase-1 operon protein HyaE
MTSPLIDRLSDELGFPRVDPATVDDFLAGQREALLFFPNDPVRYRESDDLAVVLPEIVRDLDRPLGAAVVAREWEKALAERFGVLVWPALALVQDGRHVATIGRMQDWAVYMERIPALFEAGSPATAEEV